MNIKAVIFDLDGTITEPLIDFDQIRRELGFQPDSQPLLELMADMTPQQQKNAEQIILKHELLAAKNSTLNLGVKETLSKLRNTGRKIAILTRNKYDHVRIVAEKHNLRFDCIFDRQSGPVKPDACGVFKICETFNLTPKETICVGDYLHDIQCAKTAGSTAVLLVHKNTPQSFIDLADFSIKNITQTLDIINLLEGNKDA